MLSQWGINQEYLLLAILVILMILLVFCMVMVIKYNQLNERYREFMRGNSGRSLEDRILQRFHEIDGMKEAISEMTARIKELQDGRDTSFKKMAIHRYDAFHEMGGKLSYSLCLLNDVNDGFIMTSMHNRDGCYTYVKEIIKGNTFVLLSDEEKAVLEETIQNGDTIQLM